jgi:ABC-type oligopeptide transport system substrate-binding subunit
MSHMVSVAMAAWAMLALATASLGSADSAISDDEVAELLVGNVTDADTVGPQASTKSPSQNSIRDCKVFAA